MFQFKQFKVAQDKCGMKVTTDACIQGAWCRVMLQDYFEKEIKLKILDIGTGTGLLSLMLAQAFPNAQIHAIEIDEPAYIQAKENFAQSPFSSRMQIENCSIQNFKTENKFDLIISNPPFFKNSLRNPTAQRTLARHDDSLAPEELSFFAKKFIHKNGFVCVMYPTVEWQEWLKESLFQGFNLMHKLKVLSKPDTAVKRVISLHAFTTNESKEDTLLIYQASNSYSTMFSMLLEPYYLYL